MITFLLVDATVSCKSPSAHCFCDGLIINSPSIRPTCVVAHGPSNGISEIDAERAEPNIARSSGLHSVSTDITILLRVTSFL